jgi:arsenite methyltransferase
MSPSLLWWTCPVQSFSLANGQIMADFAVARQKMTRGEAEAWIDDLSQLGREGRYFFSLNRYLFLATRAA